MEKNKLFAFVFAFIPGAGEMYLGMMKKGVIIMTLFFMVYIVAGFFGMNFATLILPVIWFYSFFDTMNMKHFDYERRMQIQEEFCQQVSDFADVCFNDKFHSILKKRHIVSGTVCIMIGLYALFNRIVTRFISYYDMPGWVYDIVYSVPTIIVSILIILFGIYLLKGNKSQKKEDGFLEYKGDQNE